MSSDDFNLSFETFVHTNSDAHAFLMFGRLREYVLIIRRLIKSYYG